jgi:hypothetical protein
MANAPSYRKQVIGSLLAALILTVLVVAIVTATIGPGLDSKELRERERIAEERREEQQEQQEEESG